MASRTGIDCLIEEFDRSLESIDMSPVRSESYQSSFANGRETRSTADEGRPDHVQFLEYKEALSTDQIMAIRDIWKFRDDVLLTPVGSSLEISQSHRDIDVCTSDDDDDQFYEFVPSPWRVDEASSIDRAALQGSEWRVPASQNGLGGTVLSGRTRKTPNGVRIVDYSPEKDPVHQKFLRRLQDMSD